MRFYISARHWVVFTLSLLLIAVNMGIHAQSVSDVYITPNSGTPGTFVTLVNTNKGFSFQCYAGGVSLGTVAPGGSLGYTVPGDAAAGSAIDFRCYITNVDTTDSVGVFSVIAPPPVDSDGDGLPDNADACPKDFAQTQNGCPEQQPPPPQVVDSDGDGLLDNVDACPKEFAQTQNGCPAQSVPPTVSQATPTSELIQFPADGPCVITTNGGSPVNVRQGPALNAPIVSHLNPGQGYPVTLMTADSRWYQLAAGWVSATVTRLQGNCSNVPLTSYQFLTDANPTPIPVMIAHEAPARYDLASLLATCPTLVDQARRLNFQAILQLIAISDGTQRCAEARRLIQQAAFAVQPESDILDEQTFTIWWSNVCPDIFGTPDGQVAATYNVFIRTLLRVDHDLADAHFANPGNSEDTFDHSWRVPGDDATCDVFHLNRPRIANMAHYSGITNNELITIAVVSCPESSRLATERVRTTIIQLIQAGFNGGDLLREPNVCDLIHEVHATGTLSSLQMWLFAILVQQCDFTHYRQPIFDYFQDESYDMSAINVVTFAANIAADLASILRDTSSLCREPLDIIRSWGHSSVEQRADAAQETSLAFYTPAPFRDCPQTFRLVRRHGEELSPAALLSLLRAADPCAAAYRFANTGTGISINLGAASACFTGQTITFPTSRFPGAPQAHVQIGGDLPIRPDAPLGSLVYPNRVITQSSDFVVKLEAVDRDEHAICQYIFNDLTTTSTEPPHQIDLSSIQLTSLDPSAFNLEAVLHESTAEADTLRPDLSGGLVPHTGITDLVTPEIGAPPELPGTTPSSGTTPDVPAEATTPAPRISTPSRGSTPAVVFPSVSSGGGASPTVSSPERSGASSVPTTSVALLPTPNAADAADMRTILDTLVHDSVAMSGASSVLGVFQASNGESKPTDLYLLTGDGVHPLTPNSIPNETFPSLDAEGTRVAFISTDTVGTSSIQLIDLSTNTQTTLLTSSSDFTIAPYAPTWSPEGSLLLVTLVDPTEHTGIYSLDLSDLSVPLVPTLLVQDAAAPTISADGDYLAYTHGTTTRRDIAIKQISTGATLDVTEQPEGSTCDAPSFDATGLTLYFSCAANGQTEFYRYDLDGIQQLPVAVQILGDMVAGPSVNTATLSNGATISVLGFPASTSPDQTTTTPLVTLKGYRVSNFRWRTYRLPESP